MKSVQQWRDTLRMLPAFAAAEIILTEVNAQSGEEPLYGNVAISRKVKTMAWALVAWAQLAQAEMAETEADEMADFDRDMARDEAAAWEASMSYSASRSITQWIILFRNTRRSVCAEIILRSLTGYRLMGPRNFLPEDIEQLEHALAAYSLASKQEDDGVSWPWPRVRGQP